MENRFAQLRPLLRRKDRNPTQRLLWAAQRDDGERAEREAINVRDRIAPLAWRRIDFMLERI